MPEDTVNNNVVNLAEYRARVEEQQSEEKRKQEEQESFFNDDYGSGMILKGRPLILIDGNVFDTDDLLSPDEATEMVDTIMHLIKLLQEKERAEEDLPDDE